MADPDVLGSQVPPGDDEVWKQIKALKQATQQALAAAASAQALVGLAANQVATQVGSAAANSFNTTTSYATYASFNLTVPAGYTRAQIVVSGFASSATGGTGGDRLFARVACNGSAGPESIGIIYSTTLAVNVACYGTYNLSGLTGGQNIPIEIQEHLLLGPPPGSGTWALDIVNVVASAIYLK